MKFLHQKYFSLVAGLVFASTSAFASSAGGAGDAPGRGDKGDFKGQQTSTTHAPKKPDELPKRTSPKAEAPKTSRAGAGVVYEVRLAGSAFPSRSTTNVSFAKPINDITFSSDAAERLEQLKKHTKDPSDAGTRYLRGLMNANPFKNLGGDAGKIIHESLQGLSGSWSAFIGVLDDHLSEPSRDAEEEHRMSAMLATSLKTVGDYFNALSPLVNGRTVDRSTSRSNAQFLAFQDSLDKFPKAVKTLDTVLCCYFPVVKECLTLQSLKEHYDSFFEETPTAGCSKTKAEAKKS